MSVCSDSDNKALCKGSVKSLQTFSFNIKVV